jgi:hypothetical protein
MYGIPRERVIGSSTFAYASDGPGGTITHRPEADYLGDGPEKPEDAACCTDRTVVLRRRRLRRPSRASTKGQDHK